jgi:hypothetical protein
MENGLLNVSLQNSMFLFTTIAIIMQIAYIIIMLLRSYIIRNSANISLKYTQDIYFSGYIFLKSIVLYASVAIYIVSFIFRFANPILLDLNYIFMGIGTIILLLYILSEIFIDYTINFVYVIISISINLVSLILNLVSYIQIILKA